MSEDTATISREEQMLGRLAELDLALAERVHAKAMAAEDLNEINALGRTYQRLARSLRQTLALKAKLAREGEIHRIRTTPLPMGPGRPPVDHLTPPVRAHIDRAAAEVLAFIERETETEDYSHIGEIEIYEILTDLARDPEFLDIPPGHLLDMVLDVLEPGPEADDDVVDDDDPDANEAPRPEPAVHDFA